MPRIYETPERGWRYAKSIASDIKIYNLKKLEKAIDEDNVFEALQEQIEEGRQYYKDRVTPEIYKMGLYERALVDVLIYEMRHQKSRIWE